MTENGSERLYLTKDLPGIGGQIKRYHEDFIVEEIPLYEACGEGRHTYITVEKRGIPTFEAAMRLANYFGVNHRDIGYAGLKDTRSISTQRFSVEDVPIEDALASNIKGVAILAATRHTNKLRLGHLAGNRFTIRIRNADEGAFETAQAALNVLAKTGAPNFYGMQRFSGRRNGHRIGSAMLMGRWRDAIDEFLGKPQPNEKLDRIKARTAYEEGDYDRARRLFPMPECRNERRVLGGLLRHLEPEHAFNQIQPRMRRLYISAYQSLLFNRTLARRLPDIGMLRDGDIAMKHQGGACFLVESAETERPRAEAFEISPTGPLFGVKMLRPQGAPRAVEDALLREEGIDPNAMEAAFPTANGLRRPLRIPVLEPEAWQEDDGNIVVSFRLPSGSYATVVMDEIMKRGEVDLFEEGNE